MPHRARWPLALLSFLMGWVAGDACAQRHHLEETVAAAPLRTKVVAASLAGQPWPQACSVWQAAPFSRTPRPLAAVACPTGGARRTFGPVTGPSSFVPGAGAMDLPLARRMPATPRSLLSRSEPSLYVRETGSGAATFERADRWLATDKLQHVAFSFLLTLGTQYALVDKVGRSERDALPLSAGVAVSIGISKELYDARSGPAHDASWRDLAADTAGILLAIGFILL